jgi:Sec-independent protein translocase protein TatA
VDTICGIGLPELVILALVGFVVVGPQRSRELALQIGRLMRRVMKSAWWKEFNQVATAIRDLPTTLVRMAELEDELRTVRSELDKATHIDFNDPQSASSADRPEPTIAPSRDPWGVANQGPLPPAPGVVPPPGVTPAPGVSTPPPTDSEQNDHV